MKHVRLVDGREEKKRENNWGVVPSVDRLCIPRERRLLGSLHGYLCLLRHLAVIGCIGLGGLCPGETYRATNEFGALQP